MNLYIRYFDKEILVYSVEEALDFLRSIPEVDITPSMAKDIREFASNDMFFPKRYKVRPRVYFIMIKTTAQNMDDFKQKKAVRPMVPGMNDRRDLIASVTTKLTEICEGWYEGSLDFKRVVMVPNTGKHEYRDTHFEVRCKAVSGMDCYNRMVEYLRQRVDARSQFPSAKGKNFKFSYLGRWKEECDL